MFEIELWEAVCLSLNIEPEALPVHKGPVFEPFDFCPPEFLELLSIALSNAGLSFGFWEAKLKARSLVHLHEFAGWAVERGLPNLPPELVSLAVFESIPTTTQNSASPAPVVAELTGTDRIKRQGRKPSWATIAMPYMQEVYRQGEYRSAVVFYKVLLNRADKPDSPFSKLDRELYCKEAGTTVAEGTLGTKWKEIRGK